MWTLHGKEDSHAATAKPEDLVKLAHTIQEHFGHLQENTFITNLDENLSLRLPAELASKTGLKPGDRIFLALMENSTLVTKTEGPKHCCAGGIQLRCA